MSLTDEQYAERFTGIGGSDCAPALGLSPFKSALELFLDKRERRADVAAISYRRWGHLLEPAIRQEYETITRRAVALVPGTMRHSVHPFMLAHVDGIAEGARVLEVKTAWRGDGWGASGSEEVPHHYLLQAQHYLAITGLKFADIAVLIGGNDFRLYEIPADVELQSLLIDGEQEFWKLVQEGTPPAPDFESGDTMQLLRRLYPGTNGLTLHASPEDADYRRVYESAINNVKTYERIADGAKAHLLSRMGEAARLVWQDDDVQLARKVIERKGYEVKATKYVDARFSKIKE